MALFVGSGEQKKAPTVRRLSKSQDDGADGNRCYTNPAGGLGGLFRNRKGRSRLPSTVIELTGKRAAKWSHLGKITIFDKIKLIKIEMNTSLAALDYFELDARHK
ncbi:MAG: hypothetical protein ACK41P_03910 [Asticcacaulis sp.]